jgi:hypothetical protein
LKISTMLGWLAELAIHVTIAGHLVGVCPPASVVLVSLWMASALVFAIPDIRGVATYRRFPCLPIPLWTVVVAAGLISAPATRIIDFLRKAVSPKTTFERMQPPAGIAALSEDLRWQLFDAMVRLTKRRLIEVIGLVSIVGAALASGLTRHAQALEFTPTMRDIRARNAS